MTDKDASSRALVVMTPGRDGTTRRLPSVSMITNRNLETNSEVFFFAFSSDLMSHTVVDPVSGGAKVRSHKSPPALNRVSR